MQHTLRILIVDDEAVARDLLALWIERQPGVSVVGRCEHGAAALAAIRDQRPDLVLLDVQMPGMSGLDVVENLSPTDRPAVVFVTAHDEYAVRAFELHAVDYLLKPVDEGRLADAIERARAARPPRGWKRMQCGLDRLLAERAHDAGACKKLLVRRGTERVLLAPRDILWVEAAGNYVRVHILRGEYLVRSSLTELAAHLDALPFARVHRGILVNVSRIESMQAIGHGDYRLTVEGGTVLSMSRRYKERVEELLGPF